MRLGGGVSVFSYYVGARGLESNVLVVPKAVTAREESMVSVLEKCIVAARNRVDVSVRE